MGLGPKLLAYKQKLIDEFEGRLEIIVQSRNPGATSNHHSSIDPSFWDAIGCKSLGHKIVLAKGMHELSQRFA